MRRLVTKVGRIKNNLAKGQAPTSAVVLSLIAGVLVFAGGFSVTCMGPWASTNDPMFGMATLMGYWATPHFVWGILGSSFGLGIVVSSLLLASKPERHETLGIIIVLLSVFSPFMILGDWRWGSVLGLIAGVLALTWVGEEKARN